MATFFIGLFIGIAVGKILSILIVNNKITELNESLNTQIMLRKNRDKFIKKQMETNINLKNNLRLVVNSLPPKIKRSYHLDTDNF